MERIRAGDTNSLEEYSDAKIERDESYPSISTKDSEFIRKAGGQYRGFVQDKEGTHFEDMFITNFAYFDPKYQKIIRLEVWSEGVDGLGDSSLPNPRGLEGFSTMITKWDPSGIDVEPGMFVYILPANFPNRQISLQEMRQL